MKRCLKRLVCSRQSKKKLSVDRNKQLRILLTNMLWGRAESKAPLLGTYKALDEKVMKEKKEALKAKRIEAEMSLDKENTDLGNQDVDEEEMTRMQVFVSQNRG